MYEIRGFESVLRADFLQKKRPHVCCCSVAPTCVKRTLPCPDGSSMSFVAGRLDLNPHSGFLNPLDHGSCSSYFSYIWIVSLLLIINSMSFCEVCRFVCKTLVLWVLQAKIHCLMISIFVGTRPMFLAQSSFSAPFEEDSDQLSPFSVLAAAAQQKLNHF